MNIRKLTIVFVLALLMTACSSPRKDTILRPIGNESNDNLSVTERQSLDSDAMKFNSADWKELPMSGFYFPGRFDYRLEDFDSDITINSIFELEGDQPPLDLFIKCGSCSPTAVYSDGDDNIGFAKNVGDATLVELGYKAFAVNVTVKPVKSSATNPFAEPSAFQPLRITFPGEYLGLESATSEFSAYVLDYGCFSPDENKVTLPGDPINIAQDLNIKVKTGWLLCLGPDRPQSSIYFSIVGKLSNTPLRWENVGYIGYPVVELPLMDALRVEYPFSGDKSGKIPDAPIIVSIGNVEFIHDNNTLVSKRDSEMAVSLDLRIVGPNGENVRTSLIDIFVTQYVAKDANGTSLEKGDISFLSFTSPEIIYVPIETEAIDIMLVDTDIAKKHSKKVYRWSISPSTQPDPYVGCDFERCIKGDEIISFAGQMFAEFYGIDPNMYYPLACPGEVLDGTIVEPFQTNVNVYDITGRLSYERQGQISRAEPYTLIPISSEAPHWVDPRLFGGGDELKRAGKLVTSTPYKDGVVLTSTYPAGIAPDFTSLIVDMNRLDSINDLETALLHFSDRPFMFWRLSCAK